MWVINKFIGVSDYRIYPGRLLAYNLKDFSFKLRLVTAE